MSDLSVMERETAVLNQKVKAQRDKVKANLAQELKELESGPQMRVEFSNNEDPPADGRPSPTVKFFFGGQYWSIKHGDVVTWPEPVVSHLNSLTRAVYGDVVDPVTGFKQSKKVGDIRRFTCLPVLDKPRGGVARSAAPKKE